MSDKQKTKLEELAEKLTAKQKLFANFYLGDALLNGTQSARLAKFTGDDKTLAVTASRLLRNANVSAYIEESLTTLSMGANEVLTRLSEIAKGKVDDVLDDNGYFNFKLAKERNKTHLLKKIKTKRTLKETKTEISDDMQSLLDDDEIEAINHVEIIYEEVEFELYSAHEALRDLGKFHKLFTERTEITGKDGKDLIPQDISVKIDKIWGKDE